METENVPTDTQLDPHAVEGDEASLEMHWNIATFLPEALSDHFKAIAGDFIVLPWKRDANSVPTVASVSRKRTKTWLLRRRIE